MKVQPSCIILFSVDPPLNPPSNVRISHVDDVTLTLEWEERKPDDVTGYTVVFHNGLEIVKRKLTKYDRWV